MLKFTGSLLAFGLAGLPLFAQQTEQAEIGPCAKPDFVTVTGARRVNESVVKGTAAIIPGATINAPIVQRAIKALFSTGNYEDVKIVCSVDPQTKKSTIDIAVTERPILSSTTVEGIKNLPQKDVQERLTLPVGSTIDPSLVAKAVERVDSLYESKGYYLARVQVDSTVTNGELTIAFKIDEGNRLAVSGIRIFGAKNVPVSAIVGVMKTKPEGFLWYRRGEFDEGKYASDLTETLPKLYGGRGYIDFLIERDTMMVDRNRGKGQVELTVREGPRYTVGNFEVLGNRRFSGEELRTYYPFSGKSNKSITESALSMLRRRHQNPKGTFDEDAWQAATDKIREAYHNQGYIYADITPIEERIPSEDTIRKVNLRWEIREGSPAIVNRVDIIGNDYTYEACIRQQIVMLPGDVFRREYLIRSYQNLSSMNFFETLEEPTVRPDSSGDVNITFKVKERRTGNINFGASMGEGTGLGGFIGLDQPNLFGRCKRAQVQLQFGRFQNDINLTYQDPNIRLSNISGSISAYHMRSRYQIADLGESIRTGGQLQFGIPVPRSYYSRIFVSYGGERVKYDDNTGTLLGSLSTLCQNCYRSTVGVTFQRDTRIGGLFPTQGSLQSVNAQFNGGPLGGTSAFQRYTTEMRTYVPIGYLGSRELGSQPQVFLFGLSTRTGMVFGNPGPFFSNQSFALGGVQFGEQLRGYCEFAITPGGYNPLGCDQSARRESFGNAFFVGTAELGFRVNNSLYFNAFFEGGNVWNRPREFDPTRLFRSIGFGGAMVSPLGPIGLDMAYGLDRVDVNGRKNPGWKLHFKLGQIF